MLGAGRKMGLTGLDIEGATRQIALSLMLAPLLEGRAPIVDVGSGAGLPGIPIFLALRHAQEAKSRKNSAVGAILVEPKRKATAFLEKVVRMLELEGVQILNMDAAQAAGELGAPPGNAVVAKAVAPLTRAFELCLPLCGPKGMIVITGKSHGSEPTIAPEGFAGPQRHRLGTDQLGQTVYKWLRV